MWFGISVPLTFIGAYFGFKEKVGWEYKFVWFLFLKCKTHLLLETYLLGLLKPIVGSWYSSRTILRIGLKTFSTLYLFLSSLLIVSWKCQFRLFNCISWRGRVVWVKLCQYHCKPTVDFSVDIRVVSNFSKLIHEYLLTLQMYYSQMQKYIFASFRFLLLPVAPTQCFILLFCWFEEICPFELSMSLHSQLNTQSVQTRFLDRSQSNLFSQSLYQVSSWVAFYPLDVSLFNSFSSWTAFGEWETFMF